MHLITRLFAKTGRAFNSSMAALVISAAMIGSVAAADIPATYNDACAAESGSKPDPQMLNDILNHTQKQIADAVFIGDSIYDIQMANKLGMTSIAVDYGTAASNELAAQYPTYQVDRPQDLCRLLCS